MCGHFGFYGFAGQGILNAFEDGLSLDQIRGINSTGVAFIEPSNKVTTIKDTVLPHKLYRRPEWNKMMSKPLLGAIGHNRAATAGAVTKENAHPFTHGVITLAHNGTIMNMDRKKLLDHEKFEVDSDNICYMIDKIGIAEAWKRIDGAATLVYYNAREQSLNIISNNQRPFEFSWVNGNNCIVWCSEVNFLKAALERNGVETSTKEDSFTLVRNRLLSFHVKKKGGLQYHYEDLEPFREPVVPAKSVGSTYRHVGGKVTQVDRFGRTIEDADDDTEGFDRWLQNSVGGGQREEFGDAAGWQRAAASTTNQSMGAVLTPKKEVVVPFKAPAETSSGITRGGMNKHQFEKNIKACIFCHGAVEFLTCSIIDDETAACKTCSDVADSSHVPLARAENNSGKQESIAAALAAETEFPACAC